MDLPSLQDCDPTLLPQGGALHVTGRFSLPSFHLCAHLYEEMGRKGRIETNGGSSSLEANPFAGLDGGGLPETPRPEPAPAPVRAVAKPVKSRMRLEVRREKAGRGGKTVTTISGVAPLGAARKEELLKLLKNRCGTGGTDRGTSIEIQGDQRETVMAFLRDQGFHPVAAGG